ncbi:MAG: cell division protein FtsZ [Candidatus Micrarchaeota archaeon]|nr:cell division protein FtsZ [Candidatus Micrarchaeota archaeon]
MADAQTSQQNTIEEKKMADEIKKEEKNDTSAVANQMANDISTDEEEILKFIEQSQPRICVVGAGGSGCNTLNRLHEMNVSGINLIASNTDARHLLKIRANKKILLGKQLAKGRGCGSTPECGEKSAVESLDVIKESIKDSSLVFVTCGMGGGTGTGALPIIAKSAKTELGALTVGVVTLPFTSEGKIKYQNAMQGLDKLKRSVDTLIVVKNDKLLSIAPDLPLNTAFKVCDEVLAGSVKGISELVTKEGLVNVDFADLNTALKDAGYAVIGVGEANVDVPREERARIAVETALNSPLLDVDISTANRVLVNIIGGEDMSLKEVQYIVEETAKRVSPDVLIKFGARIEKDMKKSALKVLIVLAGVKFTVTDVSREPVELDELELEEVG